MASAPFLCAEPNRHHITRYRNDITQKTEMVIYFYVRTQTAFRSYDSTILHKGIKAATGPEY
jgi:hypothetical protein